MTKLNEMTNQELMDWVLNKAVRMGQGKTSNQSLAEQGAAELLRRLGSGEPPQPRCPQCRGELKDGKDRGEIYCAACGDAWDLSGVESLREFFGPSAPQPQPSNHVRCTNCGMYGFYVRYDESLGGLVLKCVDCGEQKLIESVAPSGSAGQEPQGCTCKMPDFQHAICPVHDTEAAAMMGREPEGRAESAAKGANIADNFNPNWETLKPAPVVSASPASKHAETLGRIAAQPETICKFAAAQPVAANPKDYMHWPWCNGDRRFPAGEKGHGCCCFNKKAEEYVLANPSKVEEIAETLAHIVWDVAYSATSDESLALKIEDTVQKRFNDWISLRPFFTQVSQPPKEQQIDAWIEKLTEGLSSVAASLIGARIWTLSAEMWPDIESWPDAAPVAPVSQHHPTCNYWTKPIGSPGCVCVVVNRNELERVTPVSGNGTEPPVCDGCGAGLMLDRGNFYDCFACGHNREKAVSPAVSTESPRPGRTKLLMKFWSAMHMAGFAKDKEWDAQEKIHIKDLVQLLEKDGDHAGRK